jgi:hypothetical protein
MRKTIFRLALLSAVFAMPAYAQVAPGTSTDRRENPGTVAPLATTPGAEVPGSAPSGGVTTGRTAPEMRSGATTVTPGTERTPPVAATGDGARTAGALTPGANSFTEGQARSRMEEAGFTGVTDLRKDEQGIWRGRAQRNGQQVTVGLDYQGNIAIQ